MGLLARFKKMGGTEKLVSILEEADEGKRKRMLEEMRVEDAAFTAGVEAKLFFWADLFSLDNPTLEKIVGKVQDKVLATAMCALEPVRENMLNGAMDKIQQRRIKEVRDSLGTQVAPAVINVSRRKVVQTARELENDKTIQLKKSA